MTQKQQVVESSPNEGGHRDAVRRVREAQGFAVTLPIVGRIGVPRPEELAYFGVLGLLTATELIEWPVALMLGAGHLLLHSEHSRIAQEVGEALEEA